MRKCQIHEVQVHPTEYQTIEAGRRSLMRRADPSLSIGDWFHFREFVAGAVTGRHLAVRILSLQTGPQPGWMNVMVSEPEYVEESSIHWTQACGCVWASNAARGELSWQTIIQCPTHARAVFTQKPVEA